MIILDDLERFSDSIKESGILGFINNLSENLGFKVIVIANEDYLVEGRNANLTFKEKVVEKTLMYNPNSSDIIKNIISELKDNNFASFMNNDTILDSMNVANAFSKKNENYRKCLTNLRTLKFAINHFHQIYKLFIKYAEEQKKDINDYNELLIHFWFTILALSMELKNNNISSADTRTLDSYSYLESATIVFGDEEESGVGDMFFVSNEDNSIDKRKLAALKEENDREYTRWFYQFYFKSRGIGLYPLPSRLLIEYVVRGVDPTPLDLIEEYKEKKDEYMPKGNPADELLSMFVSQLWGLNNDKIKNAVNGLMKYTEAGDFNHLTGFIQAAIYLSDFHPIIEGYDLDTIRKNIYTGIDIWLATNRLTDYEKSQLMNISHKDIGDFANDIYQYINNTLRSKETNDNARIEEDLIAQFNSDIKQFCVSICPQAYTANYSYHITYPMNHPILNRITDETVRTKLNDITVSDVSGLKTLLLSRYSIDGVSKMKQDEIVFWETVYDCISNYEHLDSAAKILSQKQLKPILSRFLEKE